MTLRILFGLLALSFLIIIGASVFTAHQDALANLSTLKQDEALRSEIKQRLGEVVSELQDVRFTQAAVHGALSTANQHLLTDQHKQTALLKTIKSQVASLPAPNGVALNAKKTAQVTVRADLPTVLHAIQAVRASAAPTLSPSTTPTPVSTPSPEIVWKIIRPSGAPESSHPQAAVVAPVTASPSPSPSPRRCRRFLFVTSGCR